MRSELTLPSSGLSLRSGAKGSRNCCMLLPTRATNGCLRLRVHALPHLALGNQLFSLKKQIGEFDRMILAWHRSNQTSKRLHYIPGVGPMLATALVASVADPRTFR